MLDYHRLNGSHSMVFWRISTKKFSSFQPGDLLFFLAKGEEDRRKKEKGIVGYGCFTGEKIMNIDSLWKKYEKQTGYVSREELESAILKTIKKDKIPEKISCLLLNNVVFFQGPLYLSELGINLPGNLESFTYLDSHEGHVTLELLQKAKEIGIDYWTAAVSDEVIDETTFNNDILKYQIGAIYENADIAAPNNSETYSKHCFNVFSDEKPQWINNKKDSFITFQEPKTLYYIYRSYQKSHKQNFITTLGQLVFIKNSIIHTINEQIKIKILTNNELSDIQKEILFDTGIFYEYIK